ncbi:flagellar M-ring protein FliF [bacterium]|nr:flagellar M-ring protein FliF [bacterium]
MDQITKSGPIAALIKLWNELTATQRVVVTAFGVLAAALMLFVGIAATKPRMSVLFSGLAQEDAGAIVQKLGEQKVTYKLSADGTTIEVPENKVYDLRLQLATQGLPQGGNVGFELFDKSNFGMTEFTEKVTYQRAVTGTLTRTLCHLAPVIDAKVLLSMPEQKIYSSEQEPAKASVVLKLRRGMPLSDEQVGGVVHLVSSAVEGLTPTNVTVLDTDGNVLSEGDGAGGSSLMTASQTKMKRQYESELSQNLQSMLAKIVGADKAVVRVSADMSFDQTQTKSEEYQPTSPVQGANGEAKGVLLSEDKSSEIYAGGALPPGGVPIANSPGSAKDSYQRTQSTSQYQVTKRIQETVNAPGKLQRLSVAVLVDDKVEPVKLEAIREAVIAASGIDSKRGDQVTVQRVGFDTASSKAVEVEMAKESRAELVQTIVKNAGAALLLIVFLVFLKIIIKQIKVTVPAEEVPVEPEQENGVDVSSPMPNPADLLESAGNQAFAQTPPLEQPTTGFSTAQPQKNTLPPEITQSSPEDLARLVRNWMAEG